MYNKLFLLIICIMQFSCDKQSNPFIGDDPIFYLENMMGESRDILVLENISFDVFTCNNLEEQDCIDDIWCEWNDFCEGDVSTCGNLEEQNCINEISCEWESSCEGVTNDLLIVANQYDEGLVIYDINNNNGIELNEIYYNNNFEVLDETSIEDDLELRKLIYSKDTEMLYILDKFEYIYYNWLPGLIQETSLSYETDCYLMNNNDEHWDPYHFKNFGDVTNSHSTQIILDEAIITTDTPEQELDKALFLLKYNVDNITDLPAGITTSSSNFGSYVIGLYGNVYQQCIDLEFYSDYYSNRSPFFDYNITDVHFEGDKIFIANPYDSFIFKNSYGEVINVNYYDGEIIDGCDLPLNSVSMSDSGELFYNIGSEIGYFEFNVLIEPSNGQDLMDRFIIFATCTFGTTPNFIKCLAGETQTFIGDINEIGTGVQEIMISGNKVIGNLNINNTFIDTDDNCGTFIDLNINNEVTYLFHDDFYSYSVYNYTDWDQIIDFSKNIETNSKVQTIYEYNDYVLTGMIDDGCYIKLLSDGSHDTSDIPILYSENFTVNNIYYDINNEKLLLSCGRNGVLVYHWSGSSAEVNFLSHIVSSHAYTAKTYKNANIIVATKYGVEIYNYELNR